MGRWPLETRFSVRLRAAGQGIEPQFRRSERRVLPLDDPAKRLTTYNK